MDLLEKMKKARETAEQKAEVKPDEKSTLVKKTKVEKKPKNSKRKVTGDKLLNKPQMLEWFIKLLQEKGDIFTLDYLRGQKLNFESVYEMRKR